MLYDRSRKKGAFSNFSEEGTWEACRENIRTNGKIAHVIQEGTTKLMHKGYGVQNQLTLITIGSLFYFYLNQQFFMTAKDQSLSIGQLSLMVESITAPTEAVFSQAVAWNIVGTVP